MQVLELILSAEHDVQAQAMGEPEPEADQDSEPEVAPEPKDELEAAQLGDAIVEGHLAAVDLVDDGVDGLERHACREGAKGAGLGKSWGEGWGK